MWGVARSGSRVKQHPTMAGARAAAHPDNTFLFRNLLPELDLTICAVLQFGQTQALAAHVALVI